MATINLAKVKASSFFPGLQNIGTGSTTISVTGVIPNQGNLVGSSTIFFPKECMSLTRVTLPDAHGDLATYWFPIIGSVQLYDATDKWYLTIYTQPNAQGRTVQFDFTSDQVVTNITLTDFRISLYSHFYSYPF